MEERSEELRLALVLNGGVSLAVWMGGVSFELNRLVRETHPVYRGLLELTGTAARIDVISGTSAGGINGAALALAQLHDQGLYSLRDVWLDTGGLDELLHEPDDAKLNSLLRGDEWFLPQIRKAFAALAKGQRADPQHVPISLTLTSTLLDGERHVSLDDFGAEIEDKVHRAIWQFPHLPGDDAFTDPKIIDQLAFAARSTASFPVAFEPALYDPQDKVFNGSERLQARTYPARSVERKAFLLDGGILDNKPFEAALQAISKLPAEGNTRRVLAYIVPDPAAQAELRPEKDGVPEAPTLAQAAWRSLVSIPGSQTIASHMSELRAHNDNASSRWRRLVGAIVHMRSDGLLTSAGASLGAYRARRMDGIVDYFLEATDRGLAAAAAAADSKSPVTGAVGPKDKIPQMRRSTRQWLASTWRATARDVARDAYSCENRKALDPDHQRTGILRLIEMEWETRIPTTFGFEQPVFDGSWAWGRYTLQFMAEFTTEVLRRTQRLYALVPRWEDDESIQRGGSPVVRGPDVPQPHVDGEPAGAGGMAALRAPMARLDRMRSGYKAARSLDLAPDQAPASSEARKVLMQEGTRLADDAKRLEPMWREAYDTAASVRGPRLEADKLAEEAGQAGFTAFVAAWREQGGESPPLDHALALLLKLFSKSHDEVDEKELARRICRVLLKLRPYMRSICRAHERRGQGRGDIDEAACELRAIYEYLFEPRRSEQRASGKDALLGLIAKRLLALDVFELSAASRRQSPSAQAEIVQISGRLASSFGGSDDPAKKLNGMQLAHFGAFYKRSWRANDWTYGCLDGIDRAVRIALNPDAIQRRYANRQVQTTVGVFERASDYIEHYVQALAVGTAADDIRDYLLGLWDDEIAEIRAELAWLDVPQTVAPPVLEYCARALTRRLQLEALRREIPDIATSLMTEGATGAPPSQKVGAPFLVAVTQGTGSSETVRPELAVQLVEKNLLGSETLKMQVGTDLLTRTVSQSLATSHAALGSAAGGLNALKVLFKVTEWPIRIFHWLANRFAQPSSTSAALEAMAYGAGAAIVVAAGLSEKLPAMVLTFGWALLTGAIATSLLRNWKTGLLLVGSLLVVLFCVNKATFALVLALVAVYALLLTPWGGGLAALTVIALAAWWSAGGSKDAAWLLSEKWIGVPDVQEITGAEPRASTAAQQLKLLEEVLWPALAIGVMLIIVATARAIANGYARVRRVVGLTR